MSSELDQLTALLQLSAAQSAASDMVVEALNRGGRPQILRFAGNAGRLPRPARDIPIAKLSLTDRIRTAASLEELNALLAEGDTYPTAQRKTRAKWVKEAQARADKLMSAEYYQIREAFKLCPAHLLGKG